jgi:23S rRNA (uracil1939-C5)-methyltransferase
VNTPLRLEIESIAPGGEGLAHVTHGERRRAVFVRRAAPGDVLEADVDWTRKPARATVLRVIEPSSQRAVPPCPIAERCGGCDLMHLTLESQTKAHLDIVRASLAHALAASGASEVPHVTSHAAPRDAAYRTRARLAVVIERGRVVVGYRQSSSHAAVDVERCWVLDPLLDALWPELRELFAAERGRGEITVAIGARERPVLDVKWTGELGGSFFAAVDAKVASGHWAGAEVWLEGARAPARFGAPQAVTTGADGQVLIVPSGAFAQAHPAMNVRLGERILARGAFEGQAVLELFAGSGNFSVLLARTAASLTTVESDARAVAQARENLASRALSARIVEADADAYEISAAVRTVVLDPPRAGAAGAAARIARSKVRRVVYVSCDVATMARDIATLAPAGFRLVEVETFEMFPHTSHVEVLAILERGAKMKPVKKAKS